ncbi:MAG: DUF350 domain-containing protein [Clostridiales bacterium]|nr:MAG: DUF350 domain-containing protein [Clostridiales bacterium]
MEIFMTVIELLVYVGVGIAMMMLGYILLDFIIPLEFPKEIKNNNKAVGWLSAGIYIGLGLIIKSAVSSFTVVTEKVKLMSGLTDTVFYSLIGIIIFMISYYLEDILNYKYKFNEELKNKNEACGIMIFGIFVGISLIISGVIM